MKYVALSNLVNLVCRLHIIYGLQEVTLTALQGDKLAAEWGKGVGEGSLFSEVFLDQERPSKPSNEQSVISKDVKTKPHWTFVIMGTFFI